MMFGNFINVMMTLNSFILLMHIVFFEFLIFTTRLRLNIFRNIPNGNFSLYGEVTPEKQVHTCKKNKGRI